MSVFYANISYDRDGLYPVVSSTLIDYHYGKHHVGYANNLNALVPGSKYEGMTLEQIIIESRQCEESKFFNNAAQLYNHDFYWNCLKPGSFEHCPANLRDMILDSFGSFDNFVDVYSDKAVSLFGSGWSWLVLDNGRLDILNTSNAGTIVGMPLKPICVLDVWEHAYYIDYKNDRKQYVLRLLENCIDWNFCASQL